MIWLCKYNTSLRNNKAKRRKLSKKPCVFRNSYNFWGFYSEKVMTFMEFGLIGDNLLAMIFLDGVSAKIVIILWRIEALRVIEGQWYFCIGQNAQCETSLKAHRPFMNGVCPLFIPFCNDCRPMCSRISSFCNQAHWAHRKPVVAKVAVHRTNTTV